MIPPSIDSLILDYQSPNALPGYYPNEQSITGNQGGIGAAMFPSDHFGIIIIIIITRFPVLKD